MNSKDAKRIFLVFGAATAAIGYIFSITTGSIGIMIFLLAWLINYKSITFNKLTKRNKLWPLVLFFLFLILGSFHGGDFYKSQKILVRFIPFLLFPILFITAPIFSSKERLRIIKVFVHSLTIFFIICLIVAISRQIGFWNRGGIFNWYYFYRYDFLEVFKQHPTYLSMFTLLSLSFVLFLKKDLFGKRFLLITTLLIQMTAIIFYGSRIGYILFLFLLVIYFFRNFRTKNGYKKFRSAAIFISSFILMVFLVYKIPIVKERIFYTFGLSYDYKFNNIESINEGGIPEEHGRFLLWKDAVSLIKERPFFGLGTGATEKALLKKYKEMGHILFLDNKYNVHNSYLQTLLMGGIFLLAVYLLIMHNLLWSSLSRKDVSLFMFFLIIAITSITETIFVSRGVQFLSFFYCFFLMREHE